MYVTAYRFTMVWLLLILSPFTVSASDTSDPLTTRLTALQKLADTGANVSGLVIDLTEEKVLAELNPDRRLGSASLTKILTSAATLKAWGPNRTFVTRVLGPTPKKGVVHGDLVLLGGGDPTLNTSGIWQLAVQLSERGIHRIKGNLVIDESLFGNVACASDDRCNALKASGYSYDAPLSSAGINFATWCVAISPSSRTGSPARTRMCQLALPDIDIVGKVDTITKGSSHVNVSRVTKTGKDRLHISGRVTKGFHGLQVYRSASNAPLQTGQVFREVLKRLGIKISGDITIKSHEGSHRLRTLALLESIPLSEQLIKMMTYSNNYMADVLALNLLTDHQDSPHPFTLQAAGQQLVSINGLVSDDKNNPLVVNSGSGLTPENALSTRDVVSVLQSMYLRTDLFPAFLGSFTVPEFSPSNFYKSKDANWRTRIATKTGSLSEPVNVLGLAGYFRKQDGNWGAFAVIINGTEKQPHISYANRTQAVKDTVSQILNQY